MSHIPLLVDPVWIQSHPEARVVDLRWSVKGPPAREKYDDGHIPGAVFADLDRDLSRHGGPGRHPFPSEEQFAQVLSRWGVDPATHVVVYDDSGGSIAARLWFMLRAYGHEKGSVLDGGIRAWTEAALPLTREEPRIAPAPLRKLRLDRSRLADVEEVQARKAVLLDARAPERYRGEVEPIDPVAGHIPGALNMPFGELAPGGRFRPPEELRARFEAKGVHSGDEAVAYCGSGVTACVLVLAAEVAGIGATRLYPGSWSEWCLRGQTP
jgi:thiosulfate/3-mercaptopyruvate sulfurtransferase